MTETFIFCGVSNGIFLVWEWMVAGMMLTCLLRVGQPSTSTNTNSINANANANVLLYGDPI